MPDGTFLGRNTDLYGSSLNDGIFGRFCEILRANLQLSNTYIIPTKIGENLIAVADRLLR
jgi:hypothetical protein